MPRKPRIIVGWFYESDDQVRLLTKEHLDRIRKKFPNHEIVNYRFRYGTPLNKYTFIQVRVHLAPPIPVNYTAPPIREVGRGCYLGEGGMDVLVHEVRNRIENIVNPTKRRTGTFTKDPQFHNREPLRVP